MVYSNRRRKIKPVLLRREAIKATLKHPNPHSFEPVSRQLRGNRAAIGSGGKKARPF